MAERPELELDRNAFREIHKGPLANPRDLWFGVVLWSAGALLGAVLAAWFVKEWWVPFLIIPCAMWAGAGLAGLYPGWVFGKAD